MLIGLFGDFRNRHLCVPVTQLIASVHQQAEIRFVHMLVGRPAVFSGLSPVKLDGPFYLCLTWACVHVGLGFEEASGRRWMGCVVCKEEPGQLARSAWLQRWPWAHAVLGTLLPLGSAPSLYSCVVKGFCNSEALV